MSHKQIGGEPFPENKAVRTYEGMDQIYGPGKNNKAVLKPENIFAPMKETEQTLLEIADIVSALDGTISGPKDFDRRCKWLREQMDAYATAKAQASCEATLKKASENAKITTLEKDCVAWCGNELCTGKCGNPRVEHYVKPSSITDPSNITIV